VYNGGTHLYEYSATEFIEVLKRNFPNDEIGGFGIIEVPLKTDMPDVNYQWGSNITTNLSQAWVMVGVVTLNK